MVRSTFAALAVLVSCGADPAPKLVPAELKISAIKNKDDVVQAESLAGVAVVRVQCNHGVGACLVTPSKGIWPQHVTLLLEGLSALEVFRFTTGRMRLKTT
jgi:hypothetical protein